MVINRAKVLLVGGVMAVGLVAGTSAAIASSDDAEAPITGDALVEASAVALEHSGGGTVTETEVGDEESYYEVEVTMDDGRQIDVQLDEQFNVVGDEIDTEDDAD
jgi:uncharacterized membrane protein YkoI